MNRMSHTRHSYGILLCRYNHGKSCYEFLLEQRPYRYGFVQFLTHHYYKSDHAIVANLINDMTPEDKRALATLSFDTCYYRIYRSVPQPGSDRYPKYLIHKTHFERTFLADGGRWLLDQLSRGGSNGLHWDLPRGRKSNNHESDLECAIREFREETRIPSMDYSILDPNPRDQSFQSFGCHYVNHFYLACLRNSHWDNPKNLRVNYSEPNHYGEVTDLRWVSLQEVRVLDTYNRLYPFLRSMSHILKRHYRLSRA